MTITKTIRKASYPGDGTSTEFSFPYRLFSASEADVYSLSSGVQTLLTLDTDYSVTNTDDENGATITMTTAPTASETTVIVGNTAQTQETDYRANDDFPAETHEQALDRLTVISQELDEKFDRCLSVQVADGTPGSLPVDRAGTVLLFDDDGDPTAGPTADEIENAQGYATSASASASAAATSATQAALYEGIWLDTATDVIADTNLTYTTGSDYTVTAGDYITARDGMRAYKVAAEDADADDYDLPTAGNVKLSARPNTGGIFDATAFGATGDGSTDDAAAIQLAINAAQVTGGTVVVPAGHYRYGAELEITEDVTFRCAGRRKTIFEPSDGYTGWFMSITETNFVDTSNEGPTPDLTNDNASVELSDFSVRSERDLGVGAQHGIRCIGRNDRLYWRNVYIECLEGTHFYFGFMNGVSTNPAYVRESLFVNIESRGGGNTTTGADSVVINSYGSGDSTNLVDFHKLQIVFPYRRGLYIKNDATLNAIRRVDCYGLLLHGSEPEGISNSNDMMRTYGDIQDCSFYNLQLNSTEAGQNGVLIDANGSDAPETLVFTGNVTSGDGDTFNIADGSNITIEMASWRASGTDLTLGSGVAGPIVVKGNGKSITTSIDASAEEYLCSLVSYNDAIPVRVNKIVMGNATTSSQVVSGSGSPEGVVSAPAGSLYLNSTGSGDRDSDTVFVKQGGTGNTGWRQLQEIHASSTASRPSSPATGLMYYDTTLGMPVWYNGTNWVDATGTTA